MTTNENKEETPGDEAEEVTLSDELTEEEPTEEEEIPPYLQDEPPEGKSNYAKWALMHGKSEEELIADGANPGTVRVTAQELEKEGLRKRPPKPPKGTKELTAPKAGGLQIFAKGSPPEALVNAIEIPDGVGDLKKFEQGLKFGASVLIMGVRLAQELSSIGVQQARPLVEMAKDMRSGEAAAAKNAAGEAAMTAAGMVQQNLQPYLSKITGGGGGEGDPMKRMMTRVMEPLLKSVMGRVIPGVQPGAGTPEGWERETE